jgi:hypothetical protein
MGLPARWTIDGVDAGWEGLGWWGTLRRRIRGSVSRRDHQPLRMVISPVPAQLPRGRRDDAEAWGRGVPRNRPAVVCEVRPDRCQRAAAAPGTPWGPWRLDEVFITISGTLRYLWRAVEQHGEVLDILVQSRRNATAAKRFFRRLLKGLRYVSRVVVTDKLASYGAARTARSCPRSSTAGRSS